MKRKRLQQLLYILSDFAGSFIVWILLGLLNGEIKNREGNFDLFFFIASTIIASCWVLGYGLGGLYQKPLRRSRFKEISQVFKYSLIGVLALFFLIVLDDTVRQYDSYRVWFTTYLLLQFGIVASLRMVITTRTNFRIRNRKLGFPTILIGSGKQARSLYQSMEKMRKSLGYQFFGYVTVSENSVNGWDTQLTHLGNVDQLPELVRHNNIEELIIALDKEESKLLPQVLENCEQCSAYIKIVPDIYDYIIGSVKVSHILGAPLIEIFPQILRPWEKLAKRAFDVAFSLTALILLSPVFLLLAILIRSDSAGPIFFSQERIGKGGKPFMIHKFRSMYIDAEKFGPALSKDNDPRITKVGRVLRKLRLDEFPQFWNVLKGDMSIVGPRPERQHFIDKIIKVAPHYRHLHKVRPGITSWGQVKYGYASNVDEMVERLKFDILYLEQMSLSLDIKILLYTLIVVVEGRGK